jgi:hypothetical protein
LESVVGRGEARVRVGAAIAVISNTHILPASKYWPVVGAAVDLFMSALGNVFLLPVEGKHEGPSLFIVYISNIDWVPTIVTEIAIGLVELSPHQGEGALYIVALFVEDRSFEIVLRCPEQQLIFHRPAKTLPQQFHALAFVPVLLFDDSTVDIEGSSILNTWLQQIFLKLGYSASFISDIYLVILQPIGYFFGDVGSLLSNIFEEFLHLLLSRKFFSTFSVNSAEYPDLSQLLETSQVQLGYQLPSFQLKF